MGRRRGEKGGEGKDEQKGDEYATVIGRPLTTKYNFRRHLRTSGRTGSWIPTMPIQVRLLTISSSSSQSISCVIPESSEGRGGKSLMCVCMNEFMHVCIRLCVICVGEGWATKAGGMQV